MIVQYTIPLNLQRSVSFDFRFVRLALKSFNCSRMTSYSLFQIINFSGVGVRSIQCVSRSIHCVTSISRYTIE